MTCDTRVVAFPSYRVGLQPTDHLAQVAQVEAGRALLLRLANPENFIVVFAHNDLITDIQVGDWVRFDYTRYGALIIDRLARPGERALPRVEYVNGTVHIDPNDPAWRLYEKI